jgi:hypothetical protein
MRFCGMPWINRTVEARPVIWTPEGRTLGYHVELQTWKFRNRLKLECNAVFQATDMPDHAREAILKIDPIAWHVREREHRGALGIQKAPRTRDELDGLALALDFGYGVPNKKLKVDLYGWSKSESKAAYLRRVCLVGGQMHICMSRSHDQFLQPAASYYAARRVQTETGLNQQQIRELMHDRATMSKEDIAAFAEI